MLAKLIRLNRSSFGAILVVVGGIFVLIHLISALAVHFLKPDVFPLVSNVLLPIFSGILIVIYSIAHCYFSFEEEVRFSCTRRRALGGVLALLVLEAAVAFALSALLARLEELFAPALWAALSGAPGYELGAEAPAVPEWAAGLEQSGPLFVEHVSYPWWALPLVALGCILLGLVAGAALQRFGRRAGWTLWGFWMVIAIGQSQVPWEQLAGAGVLPALGLSSAAALVILSLLSLWSLLHASIQR